MDRQVLCREYGVRYMGLRWVIVGTALCGAPVAYGDFALNWTSGVSDPFSTGTPDATLTYADCHRPSETVTNCHYGTVGNASSNPREQTSDPDTTPFLQERITGTDGQVYYHTIVGLPTSTFAQETYIRAGGTVWPNLGIQGTSSSNIDNKSRLGSDSTGGLLVNPLNKIADSGTANPIRVEFHQIISDSEFSQDIRKGLFLYKPVIDETVTTTDATLHFKVDMVSVLMSDMSQTLPLINTATISSAGIPTGAGDFDITRDAQLSTVSAGQYKYNNGTCVTYCPDASGGTYQYSSGGFDPSQVDWKSFRDPLQNTAPLKGPP